MPIRNLDYECFLHASRAQAAHQEDWLRVGYAPRGYYLKDFCLIRAGDGWHLFHIAGTPGVSCCLPGNEIWFGHATTADFRTWTTHAPCLYIDPAGWDCGHVFAPYVLERDGSYWMLYTGCAVDNTQRIGVAASDDLLTWRRATPGPVIRPDEYGWAFCPTRGGAACRDPHVCRTGDAYSLYYTAVTRHGRACVGRATSQDLIHWQDRGPAYTAPGAAHCESSNVQELDGRYLLFFGGHYEYWSYVVSDTPETWPDQEPIPLCRGITAMEVVARSGPRWLVAHFKREAFRLFLGVVDWSADQPAIVEVDDGAGLTAFDL